MGMMSSKKAKKKKEREKEVKKKLELKRKALKQPQVEENQRRRKMKRVAKLQKDLGDMSVWGEDVLMKLNDNTLSQLEKNVRILKALEMEYERELKKRRKLNQELEEKGLTSLQEKLNYLHNDLVEQQKVAGEDILKEFEADAETHQECAEISVCKAPVEDFQEENSEES